MANNSVHDVIHGASIAVGITGLTISQFLLGWIPGYGNATTEAPIT